MEIRAQPAEPALAADGDPRAAGRAGRLRLMGRIAVRVQPRARRDEIAGERDGAVLVRVTAPPVEGKANAALRKLVAKTIGVAPSRVAVVRGESSRDKVVEVDGLDEADIKRTLGI